MPSVTEAAASAATPIGSVLQDGIQSISLGQEVAFTKYVRCALPADGFIFLVRADLLSPQALSHAIGDDQFAIDAPLCFTQMGSLHYATDTSMEESETFTSNSVVFTSGAEVAALNTSSPSIVYMGEIHGIQFAFSARKPFYRQADTWHYLGSTRWSDLASQIIDSADDLDLTTCVVSNSLPIWLHLESYAPPVSLTANPGIPLYPSYLVPRNLLPPYGVVHVQPEGTIGLAASPEFSGRSTQSQLSMDQVEITLYGLRNDAVMDFIAWVDQFTLFNPEVMGIMNIPVVRDEKRGQVELQAIGMKKSISFQVNYYQIRCNNIARQLIKSAIPTYYTGNYDSPIGEFSIGVSPIGGQFS